MVKFYLQEFVIRQSLAFYAEQPASKVIPCYLSMMTQILMTLELVLSSSIHFNKK